MAGNAIAFKDEYSDAKAARATGWAAEAWHLLTALRLLVVADRTEALEQARILGRR